MNEHLLIVDDDPEIPWLLQGYLEKNGYRVSIAGDGAAMWRLLERAPVDLLVLDIMLPGEDGLSICRKIRAGSDLPIIMLTALGEDMDRVVGLEMGADDYLPKPFLPRELLARIRGVLRRAGTGERGDLIRFADWTLDRRNRHLLSPEGVVVSLSGGEYRLLELFVDHPNRVLSRDQLAELLQGRDWGPFDRGIDIQVSRLRKRLREDAREPRLIKTIRGEGYLFTPRVSRVQP